MDLLEPEFEEVHLKDKQYLKAGVLLNETTVVVCYFTFLENTTITSGSRSYYLPVDLYNNCKGMYALTHAVLYV